MKKQLLLLALSLCTQLTLFSQYSITGKVNDENGYPLAGANVVLQETFLGQTTNRDGEFILKKIKSGTYTLTVSFLGYETETRNIQVDKNLNLEFVLSPKSILADEVIVMATRASDKDPMTHTTLHKEDYKNQNLGQDLPVLLNLIPSVVTTSDAGTGIGYTGMRIRGSDAEKINVTINGVPFNDAESHGVYWVDIPDIASSTQSIQVQRGVGTSTNGSGAFGASINLNTDSISHKPFGKASISGGSFNTQKFSLGLGTGLINNHWFLEGKASSSKSDGYVDRGWSNLKSYFAQGGYFSDKTIVKLVAFGGQEETYQAWYGLDSASMATYGRRFNWAGAYFEHDTLKYYDKFVDHYQQDNLQLHVVHKFSSLLKFNAALHYTHGKGYYQEFLQDQDLNFYGAPYYINEKDTVKTTDLARRLWLDNNLYGGTWGLTYTNENFSLVWGGAVNKYDNAQHFGEVIWSRDFSSSLVGNQFYKNIGNKLEANTYLKASWSPIDPLSLYVDVQGRGINYTASGTNKEYTDNVISIDKKYRFFNPKAGVFYQIAPHTSAYASYSVANREPTRSDLIRQKEGESVEPETLRDLEIGFKHNSTEFYTELVIFNMNYINQLVLTGEVNSVGNPIRKNVGKSNRFGGEFMAGFKPVSLFSLEGNMTISNNRTDYTDQGSTKKVDISYSPKIIAGYKISFFPVEHAEISLLGKYVGKQFLDNTQNESLKINSYFINDLVAGSQIHISSIGDIGFSFRINNLFNVLYNSNGLVSGGTAYYFPQATRNFLIGLTIGI